MMAKDEVDLVCVLVRELVLFCEVGLFVLAPREMDVALDLRETRAAKLKFALNSAPSCAH